MDFFQTAIKRVAESCSSQFANIDDHFREITRMVALSSIATYEVQNQCD